MPHSRAQGIDLNVTPGSRAAGDKANLPVHPERVMLYVRITQVPHTWPVTFGGQAHCPPKLAQVDEILKLEQLHAGHDGYTQIADNYTNNNRQVISSTKYAPVPIK